MVQKYLFYKNKLVFANKIAGHFVVLEGKSDELAPFDHWHQSGERSLPNCLRTLYLGILLMAAALRNC